MAPHCPRGYSETALLVTFLLIVHQAGVLAQRLCSVRLGDEVNPNEIMGPIISTDQLRRKYPALGPKPSFKLLNDDSGMSRYFRLDTASGRLSSQLRLDRDNLCAEAKQCCNPAKMCHFVLEIAVESPGVTPAFIKCDVEVMDKNDNTPKFESPIQTITIKENTPIGTTWRLDTAKDIDSQRNSVQNYDTLTSIPPPFSLDKKRGRNNRQVVSLLLRLKSKLDREYKDNYKFVIRAIDGGSPQLTGSMTVSIIVLDNNDNPPKFLNSTYSVKVDEGMVPSDPILTLTAKDADIGENAETVYGFEASVSPEIKRYFSINPNNGNIRLKVPLDYEEKHSYQFRVTASDAVGHLPSAVADVKVQVIDLNDEKPKITIKYVSGGSTGTSGQQIAYLTENAPPGKLVAYFSVQDRDTGRNGVVNCSLGSFKDASAFSLKLEKKEGSTSSYHIRTIQSLDREKTPQIDLVVDCWDQGRRPYHVKTRLPVRILDVNDNKPKLRLDGEAVVLENKPAGTKVVRVLAYDPDNGKNGSLVYSMKHSIPEATHLFRIDSRNGWISTQVAIDRERSEIPLDKIPITVTVTDEGSPPKTGTLNFDVKIVDVNDNAPTFMEKPIHLSMSENQPPHSQVGEIRVIDKDSVGRLRVTIDKHYRQVPFIVVTKKDKFFLNTTKSLDHEREREYNFNIIATDGEKSETTKTRVRVEDVNDNPPKIIFPGKQNKTFDLSWRESKGYLVMRINVKDPDIVDHKDALHFFELRSDTDILEIDPTTGGVLVARPIRESEIGQHLFKVEVRDHGTPVLMSSVQFILNVDRSKPHNHELESQSTPTDQAQRNLEGDIILIVVLVFVLILLVVIIVLLIYVRHWKQSSFDFLPDFFGFCCPYQNRKRANNSRTPRQRQAEAENDKLTAANQSAAVERKLSNLAQDGAVGTGSPTDFYVTSGYEFHPGQPNFGKTAVKYQTIGSPEEAEALRTAITNGHEYHEIDQRTGTVRGTDGRYYDVLVSSPNAATLGRNPHVYQTLYTGSEGPRRDKRPTATPGTPDFTMSPKQRRDAKVNVPSSRSDSNVNSNLQRVCIPDMNSPQQTGSETSGEGFSPKHKTFSSYSMAMRGPSPGEQVYTRSYPHVEASFV